MKILLLSTNADLAGAPLHVKAIALALSSSGHEVAVIFGSEGPVKDALENAGVKTYIIHEMRSKISPIKDLRSFVKLKAFTISFGPDLVHCHSAKAGMIGRLVAVATGIPCIYTVHGWGFGPGRRRSISVILKIIERLLEPLTSHFIAVSESDRQVGISQLRISSNRITTIRNGVSSDISEPNLRPATAKVIMVARNDFQKDYQTLTRALARSVIKTAIYVGHGTDDPSFKSTCLDIIGDAVCIEFYGVRADVSELLKSSSIFVLSSKYEALPLSIIEAMSKGLPIIASDVGGVNELVTHGTNGYLFQSGDHLSLAYYIDLLVKNPEIRIKMGAKSLERYQNEFTADEMMNKLSLVYRLVVARNAKLAVSNISSSNFG